MSRKLFLTCSSRELFLLVLASISNKERKDIVTRKSVILPVGFKFRDFRHGTAIKEKHLGQNGLIISEDMCFTYTKIGGISVIVEE